MKRILWLTLIIFFGLAAQCQDFDMPPETAQEPPKYTLSGAVEWVEMSQTERDERIKMFRPDVFGDAGGFERKKDPDYRRHAMLVAEGTTDTGKADLCAFYKGKILYMYAIRHKDDPLNAYYYSLLGKLYYVDVMSDEYPNFPYTSKQYRANGKPVSFIYFESKDVQYMYAPDGKFIGLWYEDKMYDNAGKQILTRTNW
jgi:hypothetical protein